MDRDLLKLRIPNVVYRVAQVLELAVSGLVIVGIAISIYSVLHDLGLMAADPLASDALQRFLGTAFNVVIGIEFLKMLSRHNMSSVVEVLLFAIARQMIIEHTDAMENLIMVISIGILFLIRKYLFIPNLDNRYRTSSRRAVEEEEEAQREACTARH